MLLHHRGGCIGIASARDNSRLRCIYPWADGISKIFRTSRRFAERIYTNIIYWNERPEGACCRLRATGKLCRGGTGVLCPRRRLARG